MSSLEQRLKSQASRAATEAVISVQKQYVEWLLGSPLPPHVRQTLRAFYEGELSENQSKGSMP